MKKSEEKIKKKRLKLKALFLMLLIIFVIVFSIVYFLNRTVSDIFIVGNEKVSDNEILDIIKINKDSKYILVSKSKLEENIMAIPFVLNVEVEKSILGDITINVNEASVMIYDVTSDVYILSNNKNATADEKFLGVPTLINYTPKNILEDLIEELSLIDSHLISKISEIEYSPNIKDGVTLDEERFIFKMNDTNTVHVNIVNLEKFAKYNEIMEIQEERGTLYLDSANNGHIFDVYGEEVIPDELPVTPETDAAAPTDQEPSTETPPA